MVVIAIIGILAALIMSAISSAKERAIRTVCASNFRQLTQGCLMYAGDYNDYLPPGYTWGPDDYTHIDIAVTDTMIVNGYGWTSNFQGCASYSKTTTNSPLQKVGAWSYSAGINYWGGRSPIGTQLYTHKKTTDNPWPTTSTLITCQSWYSGTHSWGSMMPHSKSGIAVTYPKGVVPDPYPSGLEVSKIDGSVSWVKWRI